jgi:hypothetical protein
MSIDDDLGQTTRQRRRIVLPSEPTEDELARNWGLTPVDLAEISRCRGDGHRRRYALQLCMLRTYGRFLDDYQQAPLRIVNHLSRQLQLAPVLFLDPPGRAQTEREQALRIRGYLGLENFDEQAETRLRNWLREGVLEGRGAADLLAKVEERLRGWRFVLPAPGTLDRIVTSEVGRAPPPRCSMWSPPKCLTALARQSISWSKFPRATHVRACSGSRIIPRPRQPPRSRVISCAFT